jgi:U3 small nucleolar ribonucleoprotein component
MAKKQWQLSGEVTAAQRTENSLLEEDLAFDQTARPRKYIRIAFF